MTRLLRSRVALAWIMCATALVVAVGAGTHKAGADPAIPAGSLVSLSVPTEMAQSTVGASVYLPPGYGSGQRYPVVYLLHGLPGSGRELVDDLRLATTLDSLIASGRVAPMVVVAPDDGPTIATDTEWADSVLVAGHRWASFVSDDLVDYVDQSLATCARPSARGIGGPSMGAFGAANIALTHPGEFSAVSLWSGYFIANTPLVDGPAGSASWRAASPLYSLRFEARALRSSGVQFSLYAATTELFEPQSVAFAHELVALHLPVRLNLYPGSHGFTLWQAELASELTWLSGVLHC
jgi:enterochelin esterase-like enzyme